MSADGDAAKFRKYRSMEVKHGRSKSGYTHIIYRAYRACDRLLNIRHEKPLLPS